MQNLRGGDGGNGVPSMDATASTGAFTLQQPPSGHRGLVGSDWARTTPNPGRRWRRHVPVSAKLADVVPGPMAGAIKVSYPSRLVASKRTSRPAGSVSASASRPAETWIL